MDSAQDRPDRKGEFSLLVTGARLAAEATAMLQANRIKAYYAPPYSLPVTLAALAAEHAIDAIIVRQGRIDATVIAASPSLRVIAKHGSGVDNIDLEAATAAGIPVLRALSANAQSVAEHAIALTVALIRDLLPLDRAVKAGEWPKASYVGRDIAGAHLGLVGFGDIGRRTARMALALGMSVGVFDPNLEPADLDREIRVNADLDTLLRESDVISLHCPLTRSTRHLIDRDRLRLMKPTAFLVNTARGAIVDEAALIDALRDGVIAGAGLDGFEAEPPARDNPLWSLPNVLVTPHTGGASAGAIRNMAVQSVENVLDVLTGRGPSRGALANPDVVARS